MNDDYHERRDGFADVLEDIETKTTEMLLTPHDDVGLVLKCHLITEDSLVNYLIAVKGLHNIQKAKLTFNQMVELLDTTDGLVFKQKGRLREINRIRNSFGHNFQARLQITPDSELARGVQQFLEGMSAAQDEIVAKLEEKSGDLTLVEKVKQIIAQMRKEVPDEPNFTGDNFAMLSKHEPREMLANFTRSFCWIVAEEIHRHKNMTSAKD